MAKLPPKLPKIIVLLFYALIHYILQSRQNANLTEADFWFKVRKTFKIKNMQKIELGVNYFTPNFPEKFWQDITRYGTLIKCFISLDIDEEKFEPEVVQNILQLLMNCKITTCVKLENNTTYKLALISRKRCGKLLFLEENTRKKFSISIFMPKDPCGVKGIDKLLVIV